MLGAKASENARGQAVDIDKHKGSWEAPRGPFRAECATLHSGTTVLDVRRIRCLV